MLRFLAATVALVVFTFVLPLFGPRTLEANDVLYTVTDLGALNCCYDWYAASAASAVNAHGDVVGSTSSPTDPGRIVPFLYHDGTMTLISDTYGWAAGINDNGEVTGVFTPPGLLEQHAFVYQNGVFTDIGTLPGYSNMPYALPYAINNSGTIVGDSNAAAFVYENGRMSIVKRLSARTAYAVNDGGDVVGMLETVRGGAPFDNHGFLFSNNSMIDIGTLDGDSNSVSVPLGINRTRQIVGVAWKDGNSEERAFLWQNGVFTELPLLAPVRHPLFARDGDQQSRRHHRGIQCVAVRLSRRRPDRSESRYREGRRRHLAGYLARQRDQRRGPDRRDVLFRGRRCARVPPDAGDAKPSATMTAGN